MGDNQTELRFEVKSGQSAGVYEVWFRRWGDILRCSCTCVAGFTQQMCRHRQMLLDGDVRALVSGNADDVVRLKELVAGSRAEAALTEFEDAACAIDEAQAGLRARLTEAKKRRDAELCERPAGVPASYSAIYRTPVADA
jgi:hypothetical protein